MKKERDLAADELLAAHQAIIDHWYAEWLKRETARIEAAFARQLNPSAVERRAATCHECR